MRNGRKRNRSSTQAGEAALGASEAHVMRSPEGALCGLSASSERTGRNLLADARCIIAAGLGHNQWHTAP